MHLQTQSLIKSFLPYTVLLGLIILNAWYGKFVSDTSQKQEKAKVIDVTVPLQCLVKDSKLILTEASKVCVCVGGGFTCHCV